MTDLEKYGTAVLDGKVAACEKLKREYERLLEDLHHQDRWHFDDDRAHRPIEFIEQFCKQSQGQAGHFLKLELYQKAMLQAAYGFLDDNDHRRYQEVLNIVGRKNGKTTLLSAIQLYMLIADKEGAPECYQIATARDQAMKGFTECVNMVRQSKTIAKHVRKRQSDLYCDVNMGFIKPLASNTNSLDGLNGHCIVIDELAAIKNRDVYDLMKQSMSSRSQPMLWCITTSGFVRESIFDSQYEYAKGVIEGTIKDERFLPIIYELDKRDEWNQPGKWVKANPGLGTIKSKEFLEGCVGKGKSDDTFLPTVLVKDFNLKENADAAWLSWDELANDEKIPEEINFKYAIGGMDAADSIDLNSAKLIGMRPDDPKIYVKSMYWIPQSKLDMTKDRHHPDDVPYDIWESRGLIRVVPGNKVHKRVFLDWFLEMRDKEDIWPLYIGYDPWHIDDSLLSLFCQEFGKSTMIPIRQGAVTLSQPMKDLKADFQAGNIVYDANPIDRWCFANTYVKSDVNGNIQPNKGRSQTKRIDGTASLLDAYTVLLDKREDYLSLI
ncbi:terminase large subunit [Shuttleworthella satelles]|uniref:Phage terminase, large subunit n=1 Tax=Shuttleworthella satelles DSM 14600 TaxID=626523 RepID=C4GAS7_9FIRM|nr:terminase large subunit [Shuttleworthia satelles]EEP28220.1 putative phage terminase, large subunit [Shuttleworthia satelles DSM 14600]